MGIDAVLGVRYFKNKYKYNQGKLLKAQGMSKVHERCVERGYIFSNGLTNMILLISPPLLSVVEKVKCWASFFQCMTQHYQGL